MNDVRSLREIAQGLVDGGITDVIVCPGSRSTPLALATRAHPRLAVRVLLDERSAGFFALGLARTSRRPVAVVVTSGTAVANLLPAVVEASHARVPIVLLTADRPPDLRDRGAPQTIDQNRIYGGHVRWFAELPLLDGAAETRRHVRSVIDRAVATARSGPAGPVHLNLPFREPLVPTSALGPVDPPDGTTDPAGSISSTSVIAGRAGLDDGQVTDLARRLRAAERGLIIAGPQDDTALPVAVARLAASIGYPIVADPLSGLRTGPHDRSHVIGHADHLVRTGPWRDDHLPDLVLRFGAAPTSKPLVGVLADRRPAQIVVDGDRGWSDPAVIPTTFVHAEAASTAGLLADAIGTSAVDGRSDWLAAWLEADRCAAAALESWLDEVVARGEPFEGQPYPILGELLPDGALLWVGNSMPVRDLDAFLPIGSRAIRPMSNRGASGIDGVVSTALGSAAASVGQVVLVVGDLSFLHDLNALVAARLHDLTATIVVVDNDGGGIFSFLPQAGTDSPEVGLPEHYEELFGTPHGVDIGPIVTALGGRFSEVGPASLRSGLATSIGRPGVDVLRYRTERIRNVELHREAAAAVADALSRS
jgi:2-succinyl-5-enolpyruvyl-6-hydroxy-3-cyclohexene-1-carboxylate synthase